jgi:hypothetical protein
MIGVHIGQPKNYGQLKWQPKFTHHFLTGQTNLTLGTKFNSLDYDQALDRLIKKSWPLKWRLEFNRHFSMVKIFL